MFTLSPQRQMAGLLSERGDECKNSALNTASSDGAQRLAKGAAKAPSRTLRWADLSYHLDRMNHCASSQHTAAGRPLPASHTIMMHCHSLPLSVYLIFIPYVHHCPRLLRRMREVHLWAYTRVGLQSIARGNCTCTIAMTRYKSCTFGLQ